MSTMTGEPEQVLPSASARDAEIVKMPRCTRCGLSYLPSKSTSALKLTYCSFLCELGDLGFSITGLEHMQRAPKPEPEAPPEPESVAVD